MYSKKSSNFIEQFCLETILYNCWKIVSLRHRNQEYTASLKLKLKLYSLLCISYCWAPIYMTCMCSYCITIVVAKLAVFYLMWHLVLGGNTSIQYLKATYVYQYSCMHVRIYKVTVNMNMHAFLSWLCHKIIILIHYTAIAYV